MHLKNSGIKTISVALLISFFCSFKNNHNCTKAQLIFTASLDKSTTIINTKHLVFNTKLTNISSDTITFTTTSCSFPMDYTTDAKNLRIDFIECTKNIMDLIKIPPHQEFDRTIAFNYIDTVSEQKDTSIRLGVNVLVVGDIIKMLKKTQDGLVAILIRNNDFALQDTLYKAGVEVITIDIKGSINQQDTLLPINLLWSNRINVR